MEKIRKLFSDLAGRDLRVSHDTADTELERADRNLSIAHMMRSYDVIRDDADDAVLSYTLQCSIMVTVKDLAVMAATLANGGVQPVTGKRILDPKVCRLTQAVMASAGMYDGAGRWMATVGIPAKSGVAGGLIGTLPGQLGIATMSPRLDGQGNSVRGVKIFQQLSKDMGLHLMDSEPLGATAVRSVRTRDDATVVQLQGVVNFSGVENILHEISQYEITSNRVVFDLSRVTSFNRAGRRMTKEGLRRFREEGFDIAIYDPEKILSDLEFSDGTTSPTVDSLEGLK